MGRSHSATENEERKALKSQISSGESGTRVWPRVSRRLADSSIEVKTSGSMATEAPHASRLTPIRSGRSGADNSLTSCGGGWAGMKLRPNCLCTASASVTAAQSLTLRTRAPSTAPARMDSFSPRGNGFMPRVALRPTRPVQAAGNRIDPAPSDAEHIGVIPPATLADDPPDEPPGVCSRLKGLCVSP